MTHPTLGEVVDLVHSWFPPSTAEGWDAVGLVAGDRRDPVRRVLLALDPVADVVDEALALDADLVLTHHPLLLRGVHAVAADDPKGAVVHRLVRGGCALLAAHTNADVARRGVAEALADRLGLVDLRPVVADDGVALDKIVVMVPVADADELVDALAEAGAGELGDYGRCAWSVTGTGTFEPRPGATPTIGEVGGRTEVAESRVEMIVPRERRAAVVAALRAAHPYEEPAFDVLELATVPAATGSGRIGELPEPTTLRAFTEHVAAVLPGTPQGVRVAGDLDATVRTVAVLPGSDDTRFAQAAAAGADVYLSSDLRHHAVSEQRERARLGDGRPFVVDTAHWASESPWLDVVAADLVDELGGRGHTVDVRVSRVRTDPWTARAGAPGHG